MTSRIAQYDSNSRKHRALAEYLFSRREIGHLSVRGVSDRIGVHHTYLRRLEQGLYAQPAPEILQRLALALEVPAEDLFALAGYEIPENLPTFPAYLRSKYDMSPEAARQLTDYFAFISERFGVKEKDTPATIAEAKALREEDDPIPDVESPDFDPKFLKRPDVLPKRIHNKPAA